MFRVWTHPCASCTYISLSRKGTISLYKLAASYTEKPQKKKKTCKQRLAKTLGVDAATVPFYLEGTLAMKGPMLITDRLSSANDCCCAAHLLLKPQGGATPSLVPLSTERPKVHPIAF